MHKQAANGLLLRAMCSCADFVLAWLLLKIAVKEAKPRMQISSVKKNAD
jgi:hypothetical protein